MWLLVKPLYVSEFLECNHDETNDGDMEVIREFRTALGEDE